MPLRRSRVDALDVIAYTNGIVTLDLRVSWDVRSGDRGSARRPLCGAAPAGVRPFNVDDADEQQVIPAEQALALLP